MANKYKFGRDCITVNGRDFPARYEVMERDAARDSFFTVVIWATVDGGQEVRIEVPATDKQHGAALAAAQMEAGTLADLAQTGPAGRAHGGHGGGHGQHAGQHAGGAGRHGQHANHAGGGDD